MPLEFWLSKIWVRLWSNWEMATNVSEVIHSQNTLKVWNTKDGLQLILNLSEPWPMTSWFSNNKFTGTTVPLLYSQQRCACIDTNTASYKHKHLAKCLLCPMHLMIHTKYRKSNHLGKSFVATTFSLLKQKSTNSQVVQLCLSSLSGFRNVLLFRSL